MADPSRPPTFKAYGVRRECYGCGAKLTATCTRWFVGGSKTAVFGACCFAAAARWPHG